MEQLQSSIKMLGVNVGTSILDNSNWDEINKGTVKKVHIWNGLSLFLRGKKVIENRSSYPNCVTQLRYTLFQNISQKKSNFSGTEKRYNITATRPTLHLEGQTRHIVLDKDTQLKPLKIKWIQRLLNRPNALWENLTLY